MTPYHVTQQKAGCGGATCNNSTQEADTTMAAVSLRLALAYTVHSKAAKVRHNTLSQNIHEQKGDSI